MLVRTELQCLMDVDERSSLFKDVDRVVSMLKIKESTPVEKSPGRKHTVLTRSEVKERGLAAENRA